MKKNQQQGRVARVGARVGAKGSKTPQLEKQAMQAPQAKQPQPLKLATRNAKQKQHLKRNQQRKHTEENG